MLVFTNFLRKGSMSVSMVLSMIGSSIVVEAAGVGVLLLLLIVTGIMSWVFSGCGWWSVPDSPPIQTSSPTPSSKSSPPSVAAVAIVAMVVVVVVVGRAVWSGDIDRGLYRIRLVGPENCCQWHK